ncbi:hypothetical protein M9Y10_020176 [Tritrichomonas musculus]|uniref:BZIP domain-containing protein n=1 Tax=Tritrichomonas musculus TaxID=1915356 RepID=A0ABR2GJH7_9EUKA
MSNKIDLTQFNQTNVIKKLTKSKSNENLKNIIEEETNKTIIEPIATVSRRGRKSKYNSQDERLEARRQQQREYRLRKKQELEELKKIAASIKK